jgi:hypothetical protein
MYSLSQPHVLSAPIAATLPNATINHVIVVPSNAQRLEASWESSSELLSLKALFRTVVLGLVLAAAKPAAASTDTAQLLGYSLGQSTYEDVKASLQQRGVNPHDKGTSIYAGGPMLETTARGLGVEGLQSAFMIFDVQNRLAGGVLTLNKSRYGAVIQALKSKYTLVRELRPFVGNRFAEFRANGAIITVDSPHMSFEMTVMYRTPAVKASMERDAAAEAENRRRTDREQF